MPEFTAVSNPEQSIPGLEMLCMCELSEAQVERITSAVPGGADNIQRIYPLAPVQEGMLFQSLKSIHGDPYLGSILLAFDGRKSLNDYLEALQAIVRRHDALRTALFWEGFDEPIQVVLRDAPVQIEELELNAGAGDVAMQVYARFDTRRHRIDLSRAPLMKVAIAHDKQNDRWLMMQLLHHLVIDDVSRRIMDEEICAYLNGSFVQLPPAPQLFEYLPTLRAEEDASEGRAFFKRMLGNVDEPTAPFGLIDDGVFCAKADVGIKPDLSKRIRKTAAASKVSAARLCHLAYGLVLAKLSGRRDVVFGTILSGRKAGGVGANRVVGPFVNTLPIRIQVGDGSVRDGVRQVDDILGDLLDYRYMSLSKARDCCAVPPPAPLFTALFNYRHRALAKSIPSTLWASDEISDAELVDSRARIGIFEMWTNYPFSVAVDDLGDGFHLTAQVNEGIDPERVCTYMQAALESLVEALERETEAPLQSLQILSAEEREQLLFGWNNTDSNFPSDICIHQLFERQAERTPDAKAIVCGNESLTYRQLDRYANRLAHLLVSKGVGPDVIVGIGIERSLEMIVGLLGILKAGGAYLPLDPNYPLERLAFMVSDAQPACILTTKAISPAFAGTRPLFCLDEGEAAALLAGMSDIAPNHLGSSLASKNSACILYTSGSTGAPKGVVLEHRNLVNRLTWMVAYCPYDPDEICVARVSLNFADSICELFGPLSQGIPVVLAPQRLDTVQLVELLAARCVTRLVLVPSLLRSILESQTEQRLSLLHVRYWFTSGEELTASLAQLFFKKVSQGRLFNLYGSSEDGADVSCYEVRSDLSASSVPIGRPISNTRLYLLDSSMEPVPQGVTGEIYASGAGVARGYWNRPELTTEKFLEDPFTRGHYARMYRTGDLGRWLPDGNIQFVGRKDFQVKIRGFRIELGEIEARLSEYAGIDQAVVLVREDRSGDKLLVAYYTELDRAQVDPAVVRDYLSTVLPEYMVPVVYVPLESLPQTLTGKLDRGALPSPDDLAYLSRESEEPRSDTEKKLASIWAGMLPVVNIGPRSDFFRLGGHSLKAVQLAARIRDSFGVKLTVGTVFRNPTLGAMAAAIESAEAGNVADEPSAGLIPRIHEGDLPLSIIEESIWALTRLNHNYLSHYVHAGALFEGMLDVDALQCGVNEVVERHEVLRTTYSDREGRPYRVVAPHLSVPIELVDLRGVDRPRQKALEFLKEEVKIPFDLAAGPLIRIKLLRLAELEHVLAVTVHHIIGDSWSMGLFARDLECLYGKYRYGKIPPLAPPQVQYSDYAIWQRERLRGKEVQSSFAYWKRRLDGIPKLGRLPADLPETETAAFRQETVSMTLSLDTMNTLRQLCESESVTLFMSVLAIFQLLLSRITGEQDVSVLVPSSDRSQSRLEEVMGFIMATLVMHTTSRGNPTFLALLQQVAATCREAYEHQEAPFVIVRQGLPNSADFTRIIFDYVNVPDFALRLPGLRSEPFSAELMTPIQMDLIILIRDKENGTNFSFLYNAARYSRERILHLTSQFEGLIGQILQAPGRQVDEYSI